MGSWTTTTLFGTPLPRDIAQEKRDSATYADAWRHGGGPMWMTVSADTTLGLLYLNIGNPAPDIDGRVRPGDNLYSNSIVALDVDTGKLKWYQQVLAHDLWDYDPSSPTVLVDVRDEQGNVVPAVAEAGKTGWVYVLDRRTGAPIRRSDAFVPQENMFTVPDEHGVVVAPGTLGGSDWSPTAYSPQTGYLYVDGNHVPQLYRRQYAELEPPAQWWGGVVSGGGGDNFGLFSAVDLSTGRIAWQVHLDQPTISGAAATAGGVVFTGLSDSLFVAYDARTGRELWRHRANAGVNAPPISYAVNGRQYVAVAAGGNLPLNSARGDELLAFTLGDVGAPGPQVVPTPSPKDSDRVLGSASAKAQRATSDSGPPGGAHSMTPARCNDRIAGVARPLLVGVGVAVLLAAPRPAIAQRQLGQGRTADRSAATEAPMPIDAMQARSLPPLPKGMTLQMIQEGDQLFHGMAGCFVCHGVEAEGNPAAGDAITAGLAFIPAAWGAIDSLITVGMPDAISRSPIAMPARGARGNLTPTQIRRVAAYVWAIAQVRGEPWVGGHSSHADMVPAGAAVGTSSKVHLNRRP